jgi:hypothetical protein
MQPVSGNEVARGLSVDEHPVASLLDSAHRVLLHHDPGGSGRFGEGGVEGGPSDATSGARTERRIDRAMGVAVADAGQLDARRPDAELGEVRDRSGHQSLPARLVDRSAPRLPDDDVEPCSSRVERGRQADGAATGDDQVTHG